MTPLNVNLTHLIEQLDHDLPGADALAKVTEAQQRARGLSAIGDQLIDHFVTKARNEGTPWSQIGDALGVSKQAAQQRWLPGTFQRFTDKARHAVVLAEGRARELRHDAVDTEHILAGVLGEATGIGARALVELAGSRERIDAALAEVLVPGSANPGTHIPFTDGSKAVLKATLDAALNLVHNYIGTEHIALALVRTPGKAADVLAGLGITDKAATAKVVQLLDEYVKTQK